MNGVVPSASVEPLVAIDGGTTRTRAYLAVGDVIVARASEDIGARDVARAPSAKVLLNAVGRLVHRVCDGPVPPVIAAGMITSAQGLCEVPHVPAPAGVRELGAGIRRKEVPGAGDAPVLFLPGVRSGPERLGDPHDVVQADVMRGEETLAVGLFLRGHLRGGGLVLSVGSHWKAIRVDADGRIMGSVSTLTGELIHAAKTHSVLASALPANRPEVLAPEWLGAGAAAASSAGLARAFYCVRLLEQRSPAGPDERYAFLIGGAIAADRPLLVPGGTASVVIVGAPALARAWARLLQGVAGQVTIPDEDELDRVFVVGCRAVVDAARGAG